MWAGRNLQAFQTELLSPCSALKMQTVLQNAGKTLPDCVLHNPQESNRYLWRDSLTIFLI